MNEKERSFEITPELPEDETRERPLHTLPVVDPDIERLVDEGGLIMPDDD